MGTGVPTGWRSCRSARWPPDNLGVPSWLSGRGPSGYCGPSGRSNITVQCGVRCGIEVGGVRLGVPRLARARATRLGGATIGDDTWPGAGQAAGPERVLRPCRGYLLPSAAKVSRSASSTRDLTLVLTAMIFSSARLAVFPCRVISSSSPRMARAWLILASALATSSVSSFWAGQPPERRAHVGLRGHGQRPVDVGAAELLLVEQDLGAQQAPMLGA